MMRVKVKSRGNVCPNLKPNSEHSEFRPLSSSSKTELRTLFDPTLICTRSYKVGKIERTKLAETYLHFILKMIAICLLVHKLGKI